MIDSARARVLPSFRPLLVRLVLTGLAVSAFSPTAWPATRGEPVFLTTDLSRGAGDLAAIAVMLRSSKILPAGIATTRSSDNWRERTLRSWLEVCNRSDLPVFSFGPRQSPGGSSLPGLTESSENGGDLPAVDRLLSTAKSNPTQLVMLGSPLLFGEAMERDPETASKLAKAYWVPSPDATPTLEEADAARELWESSVPLGLYGVGSMAVPTATAEWVENLGDHHSPLTDHLTRVMALQEDGTAEGGRVDFSPCLPLASILGWLGVRFETQPWGLTDSGLPAPTPESARQVEVVSELNTPIFLASLKGPITDRDQDFSMPFTRYLFSLPALSAEIRQTIQDRLAELAKQEKDEEATPREQLLSFVQEKIAVLEGLEDPRISQVEKEIQEAYRSLAGIGWAFPEGFHSRWRIAAGEEETTRFKFGLANSSNRPVTNLRAGIKGPSFDLHQEVASATGETFFEFDALPLSEGEEAWTLTLSWEIAGRPSASTWTLPVFKSD